MKNFDSWNIHKKHLEHIFSACVQYHEREIWWCSIGINLGHEQDGKNSLSERPVLVVKKFNPQIAWILPLSSKLKIGKYYYTVKSLQGSFTVILSQLRLISVKRFRRYMKKLSPHQFQIVKSKLIDILLK